MLSVVIEAFKKSVIFPPYTFRKSLLYSDWALYHLA